jgi:hypothetical protein
MDVQKSNVRSGMAWFCEIRGRIWRLSHTGDESAGGARRVVAAGTVE